MIEKLYESYDDNNYYIDTNKKKLAMDNAYVIGGMLTFFIVVSIIFVAIALAFGDGVTNYGGYIPGILVMALLIAIDKYVSRKERSFEVIRVYALAVYTLVILNFAISDVYIYRQSRAVFFPVAIVLLSALYMDYFWVMFL